MTGGTGVDVVLDPVGGPHTEPALRAMAWDGRLLVVGFAAGDIPRIPLNLLLLKGCSAIGVFWGEFMRRGGARRDRHLERLMALCRDGAVRPPIAAVHPLPDSARAIQALTDRRAMGKVVVTMEQVTMEQVTME